MPAQGARLMLMIGAAVAQLRRLDTLVPVLQSERLSAAPRMTEA